MASRQFPKRQSGRWRPPRCCAPRGEKICIWSAGPRAPLPGCTWSIPTIRFTSSTSTRSAAARPRPSSTSSGGNRANRLKESTIARKRLELVPSAALVLRKMVAMAAPQRVIFSAFGLREGYACGFIPAWERKADPLIAACSAIARRQSRFGLDGDRLQAWTAPLFPDQSERARRIHRAACWLSDIAWSEHPDYRAEQAFTRSLRMPFGGISHADRVFIAAVLHTRYGGATDDAVKEPTRSLLDERVAGEVLPLGLALRFAYTLCGGTIDLLSETWLGLDAGNLILEIPSEDSLFLGETVQRRLDALARSLGTRATVRRRERSRAARV